MKTITFYSYKGGVGRTLALANIAKRLAEFGKKVCMIDFDLEAPGLHHKFKDNIGKNGLNQGIVDYIHYFNCNNSTPKSLKEYVTPLIFNNKYKNIDFIAAGNVYSEKYWKTLFSIDWVSMFYKKNSQGVALFVDLKERIKNDLNPDYLLIDSRTGISEISGITMSLMADELVLFAAKNDENLQGIKQIIRTLSQPENTLTGKLPKLNFVLCRIPYFESPDKKIIEQTVINEVTKDLKTFINEYKLVIEFEKLFIIHSEPTLEIEEKLLMGYQYEKEEDDKQFVLKRFKIKTPIASDYLELFEELTKEILSEKEKLTFNDLKKSEFIIENSRKVTDSNKKIELLKEAINLNPKSDEAFSLLSKTNIKIKNFDTALDFINKAIKLKQESNDYLYTKGIILYEMKKPNEAEALFKKVLKRNKSYFSALSMLGHIYYIKKDYLKALYYNEKIVAFFPDFHGGYNGIGNIYRVLNNYEKAFENVYKALSLNPKDPVSTGTLSEIYAQIGNENEFFKNFELSLSFGMTKMRLEEIFEIEIVYKPYFRNQRFLKLLEKYNIDIDLSKYD